VYFLFVVSLSLPVQSVAVELQEMLRAATWCCGTWVWRQHCKKISDLDYGFEFWHGIWHL